MSEQKNKDWFNLLIRCQHKNYNFHQGKNNVLDFKDQEIAAYLFTQIVTYVHEMQKPSFLV